MAEAGKPGSRMTPTLSNQLYRDVRAKVRRELFNRVDVPWMKAKELDIILEVLARLQPARCLEWGAGLSTLYFPTRIPGLTRWLSIEHHREWYQTVAGRNTDDRVEVKHIPPDQGDYLTTRQEGTLEDFRTYIGYPETLGEPFHFILVDGRARRHCLHAAFRLVTDRGSDAISAVVPDFGPYSTEHHKRLEQVAFLTRVPPETKIEIVYKNPGASEETVNLESIIE